MRVVVDTNLWVSYLLQPDSPFADRLDHIIRNHTLLYSHSTLAELAEVLIRPKFRHYIASEDVRAFITQFVEVGEEVEITSPVVGLCRDPRDDKFLELAIAGRADCILSGDGDLLELHPFRDIPIWRLTEFQD